MTPREAILDFLYFNDGGRWEESIQAGSTAAPDTRAEWASGRADGGSALQSTRGLDCPPRALRRQHTSAGAVVFAGAAVFGLALLVADAVTQGLALAIAAVLP